MNKWKIAGTEEAWRVFRTDVATKESEGFTADRPMKLVNALSFVMDGARLGDIIELPNGEILCVAFTPALA